MASNQYTNNVDDIKRRDRQVRLAKQGQEDLGALKLLPGTWTNTGRFQGRGWNLIALPFQVGFFDYRLLMNQYEEELSFVLADSGVPNRGINAGGLVAGADQFIVALDYQQKIIQVAVDDFPKTDEEIRGKPNIAIHHEPGLFLNMKNNTTNGLDIARLGTIPHGDSVLALGKSETVKSFDFNRVQMSGLPIGVRGDVLDAVRAGEIKADDPSYLDPYIHFHQNPFKGNIRTEGFPGFEPVDPLELLRLAAEEIHKEPGILQTTVLDLDTTLETGGIVNIPFVVGQANATEMRSIFWIHELVKEDDAEESKLVLQYAQIVMLEFFARQDGEKGLIKWPHVSINTLEKSVTEGEDALKNMLKSAIR